MLFQTYYRLNPWKFEPPLAMFPPLRFDLSEQKFSLYVNYVHAEEENNWSPQLLIRALHAVEEIDGKIIGVFNGDVDGDLLLDREDGFNGYPQNYCDFIVRTHAHMDRAATDLFNIIRWRFGIDGGPLTLKSEWFSMRWDDGSDMKKRFGEHGFLNNPVPKGAFTISLPEMQNIALGSSCVKAIEEVYQLQAEQPLYHDLFREAWQNRNDNPRSALVMAIAAAETAIKTAAVDLSDDKGTAWIFENLPSPPLDKLIREYLELLPARRTFSGKVCRPPKSVIAALREGVELRNKLVHGRSQGVESNRLNTILIAVRDLLYLLDFYRGHDWALERLTASVADQLRKGTS